MSWLLLAVFSALFWGVAQVFIKKGFSNLSPLWNTIIGSLLYFLIYIPFALVNNVSLSISPAMFGLIVFISFLYIFFYYAIEKGQISLTGTLFASYPVFVIILSAIFLQERLRLFQIILIGCILIGGILLSLPQKKLERVKSGKARVWVLWALFGAATTGLGDFLAKVSLSNLNIHTYLFYFALAYAVAAVLFWVFDKDGRRLPKKLDIASFRMTVVGIALLAIGFLFFNLSLASGQASLVATISSSYIAITAVLAYLFLKESINLRQALGILLIFIGVAAIGL